MKYSLILLFACQEITIIKNEPLLMAELEIVEKLFEKDSLNWNINNLVFRLVFDENLEEWDGDGVIMTYGILSIISAVWPWNKDEYLNEYFELIKR